MATRLPSCVDGAAFVSTCVLTSVCGCMTQAFTEKSLDFQQKIIDRSGLGDETYLPDGTSRALHAPVTLIIAASPWSWKACKGGCQAHVRDFGFLSMRWGPGVQHTSVLHAKGMLLRARLRMKAGWKGALAAQASILTELHAVLCQFKGVWGYGAEAATDLCAGCAR